MHLQQIFTPNDEGKGGFGSSLCHLPILRLLCKPRSVRQLDRVIKVFLWLLWHVENANETNTVCFIWKILVKMVILPQIGVNIKKSLKPPPSLGFASDSAKDGLITSCLLCRMMLIYDDLTHSIHWIDLMLYETQAHHTIIIHTHVRLRLQSAW